MNRKQLTLVVVLGVVFGAIALMVLKSQKASYQTGDPGKSERVIANFPLNDVGHITIRDAASSVNVLKADDRWVVAERNNYPANFAEVSEFLRKVWELRPVEQITVGPSQFGRLHLTPPDKGSSNAATIIEFKDAKGAPLKSLALGKQQMRESQSASPFGGGEVPVGRYVQVPDTEAKVFLVSETFAGVEPSPAQWLNKDFFKVEKVRSVAVTSVTNSWKVARETESGEFKLADPKEGEQLDTGKASGLGWVLSSPTFNDVATNNTPEATGLDQALNATIETFDNLVYNVKIGKPVGEDYYFKVDVSGNLSTNRLSTPEEKPEDKDKLDKEHADKIAKLQEKLKNEQQYSQWVYLVGKWTVESLMKSRQDLLAEKKPEGEAAPSTNAAPAGAPFNLDLNPPPFPPPPQ